MLGTAGYDAAPDASGTEQVGWDAPLPGPRALLTGQSIFLQRPQDVQEQFPGSAHRRSACGPAAALPILVRGEPIAALVVWDAEPVGLDPVAAGAADRAGCPGRAGAGPGPGVRGAGHRGDHACRSRCSRPRLPAGRDAALAARYIPGRAAGCGVGGDWYDCVEVGDHRVALVVGDVMGKGLHAAAVMGQMRTTLRSLTGDRPLTGGGAGRAGPGHAATWTADEIATVAYILLDLDTVRRPRRPRRVTCLRCW